MDSPLTADAKLVKEFDIKDHADLEPVFKLSYVRQQIDEFRKVLWRNRVDAIISASLLDKAHKQGKDELEGKIRENLSAFRVNIRQIAQSLEVFIALKDELEPLVGAATAEK